MLFAVERAIDCSGRMDRDGSEHTCTSDHTGILDNSIAILGRDFDGSRKTDVERTCKRGYVSRQVWIVSSLLRVQSIYIEEHVPEAVG